MEVNGRMTKPPAHSLSFVNQHTFQNQQFNFKGDILYHQVLLWLAVTSRFKKSASSDITGACVHPHVCWIDQSTSLPNGL